MSLLTKIIKNNYWNKTQMKYILDGKTLKIKKEKKIRYV